MESATATVVLPAPGREVFDYLSRIESVPEWATEFVQAFDIRGPREARARTAMGEVTFRLNPDPDTGVIDIHVGPDEERMALFPTRVVSLDEGRSAYVFTMFRAPDQTEERFRAEYVSLRRELDGLARRFSSGEEEAR